MNLAEGREALARQICSSFNTQLTPSHLSDHIQTQDHQSLMRIPHHSRLILTSHSSPPNHVHRHIFFCFKISMRIPLCKKPWPHQMLDGKSFSPLPINQIVIPHKRNRKWVATAGELCVGRVAVRGVYLGGCECKADCCAGVAFAEYCCEDLGWKGAKGPAGSAVLAVLKE